AAIPEAGSASAAKATSSGVSQATTKVRFRRKLKRTGSIWAMSSGGRRSGAGGALIRCAEEREGALRDQVGGLVGDEVTAALDQLEAHVVGVALPAGEHLRTQGEVLGAVELQGGDGQAGVGVAAADDLGLLAQQERPVHLHPGVGAGGLGEVVGEDAQRLRVEGTGNLRGAAQHLPHEGALT